MKRGEEGKAQGGEGKEREKEWFGISPTNHSKHNPQRAG